jgi:hypothetical protein
MKYFSILFILLSAGLAQGQNNGFLGKKNVLSIDARILPPLYYNFRISEASAFSKREQNGKLIDGRNLLDLGLNVTLGHAFSSEFALMIQGSINTFDVNLVGPLNYTPYYSNTQDGNGGGENYSLYEGTFIKAQTMQIMPIIELGGGGGLLPVGLVHQIGLGFGRTKILDKNYRFEGVDQNSSDNSSGMFTPVVFTNKDPLFDEKLSFVSTSLMYKIGMRIPINNFITYNIGLRYNINITTKGDYFSNVSKYIFDARDVLQAVKSREYSSFSFLETGISFVF